jgi:hypothetical protein
VTRVCAQPPATPRQADPSAAIPRLGIKAFTNSTEGLILVVKAIGPGHGRRLE